MWFGLVLLGLNRSVIHRITTHTCLLAVSNHSASLKFSKLCSSFQTVSSYISMEYPPFWLSRKSLFLWFHGVKGVAAGVAAGAWVAPILADQEAWRTEGGTGLHCNPKFCPLTVKPHLLKGPKSVQMPIPAGDVVFEHTNLWKVPLPSLEVQCSTFPVPKILPGTWSFLAGVCSVLQSLPDGEWGKSEWRSCAFSSLICRASLWCQVHN